MHRFTLLIEGCVAFVSTRLEETRAEIEDLMSTSGSSVHIKNLQSIQLQYAVTAVGIFSMFDADLQRELDVDDGFRSVRALLEERGETELLNRFEMYCEAINVLKHGRGRSYDRLCDKMGELPFRIKAPDEEFFDEGDCSEIDTLVLADDDFVQRCAEVVHQVSEVVWQNNYPPES